MNIDKPLRARQGQPRRSPAWRGPESGESPRRRDPLYVQSVEKAFRVLAAFDARRPTLGLSQLAEVTGMDLSAAQRFAHTLERLGYLKKNPHTRHFELTTKTLAPAYHFTQSNPLVRRAVPYLVQLSRDTEEATNLSMLEGSEVVFVARFISRRAVAVSVTVGSRMPAYCSASGVAILAHLPLAEAKSILAASELRAFTPHTVWKMPDLLARLPVTAERGYAMCCEEMTQNDISIAAPILSATGLPVAAVNVAVSKEIYDAATAERRFAPLVMDTARAISG